MSRSGLPRTGQTWSTGESPAKGHCDFKALETPLPQGKVERFVTAWPGEEKTQGETSSAQRNTWRKSANRTEPGLSK